MCVYKFKFKKNNPKYAQVFNSDDTCLVEEKPIGKTLGFKDLNLYAASYECVVNVYGEPSFVYREIKKDEYSYNSNEEDWLPNYFKDFHYPLKLRVATWERDSLWSLCVYFVEINNRYRAFAGYQENTELLMLME